MFLDSDAEVSAKLTDFPVLGAFLLELLQGAVCIDVVQARL